VIRPASPANVTPDLFDRPMPYSLVVAIGAYQASLSGQDAKHNLRG
jgi:hypothetical protein